MRKIIFPLLIFFLSVSLASATVTDITATDDALIDSAGNSTNYGTGQYLGLQDYSGEKGRSILKFDIYGTIGTGKTISSSTLSLYYFENPAGNKSITAYDLSRTNWVENQVTWDNYKTGTAWTSAGGDYGSLASDSVSITNTSYGWYRWNVLDIATSSYANATTTEILLRFNSETGDSAYPHFHSTEYGSLVPTLSVEYSDASNPVPTLTSISPASTTQYSATTTLVLVGTNFVASSSVYRASSTLLATTVSSSTYLTAVIPSAALTTVGTSSIVVFNPSPGGGTSTAQFFEVVASTTEGTAPTSDYVSSFWLYVNYLIDVLVIFFVAYLPFRLLNPKRRHA